MKTKSNNVDPVGQFLNLEVQHSSTDHSSSNHQDTDSKSRYESPFLESMEEDSLGFEMMPLSSSSSQKNWLFMTVFTIMVAVFVIPESTGAKPQVANQISSRSELMNIVEPVFELGKGLIKYAILFLYSLIVFSYVYKKFFRKKKSSKGVKTV